MACGDEEISLPYSVIKDKAAGAWYNTSTDAVLNTNTSEFRFSARLTESGAGCVELARVKKIEKLRRGLTSHMRLQCNASASPGEHVELELAVVLKVERDCNQL